MRSSRKADARLPVVVTPAEMQPLRSNEKQCVKGHRYRASEKTRDKTRNYERCPDCASARDARKRLRRGVTS